MPIKTRRWNDPAEADDGLRLLVTRFRPRGLAKGDETWDVWWPQLAPSKELLADFQGKHGAPLSFADYTPRYLAEMEAQGDRIRSLAGRVLDGETVTLLCSASCVDEQRCHRTLLARLIEDAVTEQRPARRRR